MNKQQLLWYLIPTLIPIKLLKRGKDLLLVLSVYVQKKGREGGTE